ncbi:hypothetical protein D3C72_2122630 [compost metagenome]
MTTGTMNSWAAFRANNTASTVSVTRQKPLTRTSGVGPGGLMRPASWAVTFSSAGSSTAGSGPSLCGEVSTGVALSIIPLASNLAKAISK